jgi:rhodanese-related sulfurtransferase
MEPSPAIASAELPLTEPDVPRVSVEEAKAAFDSGSAVLVDVRHPNDYESSHIAGAISIPLLQIERDLASLTLNKEQRIITYCT